MAFIIVPLIKIMNSHWLTDLTKTVFGRRLIIGIIFIIGFIIAACFYFKADITFWPPSIHFSNAVLPDTPRSRTIISTKSKLMLSGNVVDASTTDAISQADIIILGRTEHTTSDSKGNFTILFKDIISSGTIIVTKKGYIPVHEGFDLPNESVITIQLNKVKN